MPRVLADLSVLQMVGHKEEINPELSMLCPVDNPYLFKDKLINYWPEDYIEFISYACFSDSLH